MCCDGGCHFLNGFELSPWIELYCELSYNCIFSCDLCANWGTVMLDRDISAAGLTLNTAGCFSTGKHQSLPPSCLFFSFFFICSLSFFQLYLLSLILCFSFLPTSLPVMLSLAAVDFPSSIICLSCNGKGRQRGSLRVIQLLCLLCSTHTHCFFLSLHLTPTHSLFVCLSLDRMIWYIWFWCAVSSVDLYMPPSSCSTLTFAGEVSSCASSCGTTLCVPGCLQSHRLLTFGMMSHNGRSNQQHLQIQPYAGNRQLTQTCVKVIVLENTSSRLTLLGPACLPVMLLNRHQTERWTKTCKWISESESKVDWITWKWTMPFFFLKLHLLLSACDKVLR